MRHVLLNEENFVVSIVSGDKPAEHWLDYPLDAPGMSKDKIRRTPEGIYEQTSESWLPSLGYDIQRMNAYPAIGDQLGAIWKVLAPLINHPEAQELLEQIQAIKTLYPKPA